MSTSSLTPCVIPSRSISIEAFAALATASVIGAAWWMGSLGANRQEQPMDCPARAHLSSAQVEHAIGRVREADRRARYASMAGSGYTAAKIGLPRSSPEYRLAQEATEDLAFARRDLAQLCGVER